MPRQLPRIKPGQPITAAFLNLLAAEVERLQRFKVGPGLDLSRTAVGDLLRPQQTGWFYARITGGQNPYAWTEYFSWADPFTETDPTLKEQLQDLLDQVGRSGTIASGDTKLRSPAYEVNGNPGVPIGTLVLLRPAPGSSDYLFQHSSCQ